MPLQYKKVCFKFWFENAMASATTDTSGGKFFDSIKKSFADVPVNPSQDNAIETSAFLEASESLTTLFGIGISSLQPT